MGKRRERRKGLEKRGKERRGEDKRRALHSGSAGGSDNKSVTFVSITSWHRHSFQSEHWCIYSWNSFRSMVLSAHYVWHMLRSCSCLTFILIEERLKFNICVWFSLCSWVSLFISDNDFWQKIGCGAKKSLEIWFLLSKIGMCWHFLCFPSKVSGAERFSVTGGRAPCRRYWTLLDVSDWMPRDVIGRFVNSSLHSGNHSPQGIH